VNFRGMGTRDPITRGEKRRIRRRQASIDATAQAIQEPQERSENVTPRDRPRHSAPIAPLTVPPVVDELSAVIAKATEAMQAKWQRQEDREDLAMMRSVVAGTKGKPPPE
jgi:hypothetical protein